MSTRPNLSTNALVSSLDLRAARLHARIAGRLPHTSASADTAAHPSVKNSLGSLWSPLRLDLLKAPLSRYRE